MFITNPLLWCYDYRVGDRNRILFKKSNWIEIDFLVGICNWFWLTATLAKTTHCSEFKEWQLEPQSPEYADLITRIACRGGCFNRRRVATPPTPVSMTQFLLSPWTIVPPAVPRGHVDFKAMLCDDRVFPHQLIRDYCPAIIELRRRRSDEVYTTSRIGGCSYRRLRSYSEAFSRIPTLRCLGDEYELTGAIIGRRLRPICAMGGDAMQIGWPRILLVWQLTAGWLTANATHSRSITAARPAPNLSSPLPMRYAIWWLHAPVI